MSRLSRRISLGFTSIVLLAGCSGREEQSSPLRPFRLDEVARIGSQMEGPAAFMKVAAVVPLPSQVLILESQPPRVAVFDSSGTWIRDLGREGDGPGEFQRPSRIGYLGDQLWVGDPWAGRIELLSSSGQPVRSIRWRVEPDSLGTHQIPTVIFADGSILAGPSPFSPGAAAHGAITHQTFSQATEGGLITSELYVSPVIPGDFFTTEGQRMGVHPLRQSPLVDFFGDGSGLAVVERYEANDPAQASYRLLSIAPDGRHRFELEIPYEPRSAEGWRERYETSQEEYMLKRFGSINRSVVSDLSDALVDRSFYPPVTQLLAGRDGSTWVRREEMAGDSVAWDLFDETGTLVGHLSTGKSFQIVSASLEEVWAVVLDDLDVPFVLRMKVEGW